MAFGYTTLWEYTGTRAKKNYGKCFRFMPIVFIHRFVYIELTGENIDGLVLDHLCRNRPCCNPSHLEPVTAVENTRRGNELREPPTHCRNGHLYTPTTMKLRHEYGKVYRRCLVCVVQNKKERK